ncbi:MAG: BrnA antitoxin family protein [Burkholderiales bacterium]|jgi:uncharacterized protein (DUF4415 family)|nr:BrnA antitoxin family protein [Burkholderiales bacterium]
MTAKKIASARTLGSDLKKVDAHRIEKHEYAELPELTDDMLSRATINKGGRPKSDASKVLLSVRYSPEVVEYFRGTGAGWQARMDGVLKKHVAQHARHLVKEDSPAYGADDGVVPAKNAVEVRQRAASTLAQGRVVKKRTRS